MQWGKKIDSDFFTQPVRNRSHGWRNSSTNEFFTYATRLHRTVEFLLQTAVLFTRVRLVKGAQLQAPVDQKVDSAIH